MQQNYCYYCYNSVAIVVRLLLLLLLLLLVILLLQLNLQQQQQQQQQQQVYLLCSKRYCNHRACMFVPLQYSHRNRQYQALSVRHWYSSKSNLESSKVVGNFSLWGRTDRVWDFPSAEISLRSDLCFLTRPSGQRLLLESTTWTFANGVSGMSRSWPDKKRRENQNTGCK